MSDVYIFCLHIMFADLRDINTILQVDYTATVVFLLPYTFMTIITFGTMFTAIISNAFLEASENLHVYEENRKVQKLGRDHWIYRFQRWIK